VNYPSNVVVHGNGFVQIVLADGPYERETRLHIWHPELTELTQNVNTQIHDHRFGFVATVLKGEQHNTQVSWRKGVARIEPHNYRRWFASGERLDTGNRPLVCDEFPYEVMNKRIYFIGAEESYTMYPRNFHVTKPGTDVVVTLMNKTIVLTDYKASVFCKWGQEPDQEFDRRQIPWDHLETLIKGCLKETPFENERLWA